MQQDFYVYLKPGSTPPVIEVGPFKAVVVIEEPIDDEWRNLVSDWLVQNGCRYMMAWGDKCSLWDDSVDWASIEAHADEDGLVPDDLHIMTTWHDDEPLSETLWYAAHTAFHPEFELDRTLIVHIAAQEREQEMLGALLEERFRWL